MSVQSKTKYNDQFIKIIADNSGYLEELVQSALNAFYVAGAVVHPCCTHTNPNNRTVCVNKNPQI